MPTSSCVIYARVSVSSEESVSVARQVEAARQYAAARGWRVVGEYVDDGVSASHHRPEDRAGWRRLLAAPEAFDAVLIWKVDRLSRRVLDFLVTQETLEGRGAGLVTVEQSIDMTTPEGRGFAQMLAVFAEMEAGAISSRVSAARRHLVRSGRLPGGRVPYGWMSVPNPDGPGRVLALDPETSPVVEGIARRTLAGATLYSTMQDLNERGVPSPTGRAPWTYNTVERVVRHVAVGGLTPWNPGNKGRARGDDVLRDSKGLPIVNKDIAILSLKDYRRMIAMLDEPSNPQRAPRALKGQTSALLSGLLWCDEHGGEPVRMHRCTTGGRPGFKCPKDYATITNIEDVIVQEFLRQKGERLRWRRVEVVHEGGAALLPEIEARLDELDDLIRSAPTREARAALQAQQGELLDARDEARAEAPRVEYVFDGGDQSFAEDWAAAGSVEERRAILDDGLARVLVKRGPRGGRRAEAMALQRLTFEWIGETGPQPQHDETSVA